MWIFNIALIFLMLACICWLFLNYRQEIGIVIDIFFSSCQSVVFAFGIILVEAIKAAIIAALGGGAVTIIFLVAKAPPDITKAVGLSLVCLIFGLCLLKSLWENFHNIFWSIRNQVRNRNRH